MNQTIIRVQDMSCGHCVASVQGALERVDGVEGVEVSLETKLATVSYFGELDGAILAQAVEAVGFTPELEG